MIKQRPKPTLRAVLLSSVFFAAPAVQAQSILEEITVTATKRESALQDTALSVTAITGNQMRELGYTNAQQVTAMAPGVSTIQPNGESNYAIAIRGAANSDFTTNVESPVAVYVDEVYISQSSGSGFQLFDMERVEILRGPQGTLFGRNATGGLVHFITVKPTDEFEGYTNISYGRFNRVRVEGAINVPITDNWSSRVSFATNQGDGYVENRLRPDQDLNNANDVAARAQLMYSGDKAEVLFNARYNRQDIRTGFFEYVSAPEPTGVGQPTSPNPSLGGYVDLDGDVFAGEYDFPGRNFLETWGGTATIKYDFENFQLTSITDFSSVERNYIEDSDASPVNYFNFFLTTDAETFSQELRLTGETEKFDWAVGAYYIDISVDDSNGSIAQGFIDEFLGLVDPASVGAFNGVDNPYDQSTESVSLFGQIDYHFTEKLTFTLGGRFIHESKDFSYNNNGVLFSDTALSGLDPNAQLIVPDLVPAFTGDNSWDMWSARAVLSYQATDDLLIYGGWNRGVRGGGFNAPLLPGIIDPLFYEYEDETLNAFEVGMKAELFDGKARLNASAYYYDYDDYQAFSIIGLDTFTLNADAENYGFEVELQANLAEGLDFVAGVGYISADVDNVPGVNTDAIDSDGNVIAPAFREGSLRPVQTPEWNLNAMLRYEFPVEGLGGNMVLQGDVQYRSEHFFNLAQLEGSREDGYAVVNTLVSYIPEDKPWRLDFGVTNLFDEEYLVQTFDLSGTLEAGGLFGMIEQYYGRPRMWRVAFNIEF